MYHITPMCMYMYIYIYNIMCCHMYSCICVCIFSACKYIYNIRNWRGDNNWKKIFDDIKRKKKKQFSPYAYLDLLIA